MTIEEKEKYLRKFKRDITANGLTDWLLNYYFKNYEIVKQVDPNFESVCSVAMDKVDFIIRYLESID